MNFKTFLSILCVFVIISCGDDGAPTITINSPENGSTYAPGDSFTIDMLITDDIGISSVSAQSTLVAPFSETFADMPTNLPFNLTVPIDSSIPAGEYSITMTATDTDGNTDVAELTVNVQ